MSLPATSQSLTPPLGFPSQESGLPPRRRRGEIHSEIPNSLRNSVSSFPTQHLSAKTKEKFLPHQGSRGVGFRGQSRSWERRGSVVYLVLHFCMSTPEPRVALVLTRSSGDRCCYWSARRGLRGRGVGAGRRQQPRASRATTSSPPSGCGRGPKELKKEPGEGEKRSSISSSSTPRKRPSSGDPRRPPDPRALEFPVRPPGLCEPPRATPRLSSAGRLNSCGRLRELPSGLRRTGERGTAARQRDRLEGP